MRSLPRGFQLRNEIRKRPIPLDEIIVGDTLHLTVPENRFLSTGVYAFSVEAVIPHKKRGERHIVCYLCSCCINEETKERIHVTVYLNPHLSNPWNIFLSSDRYPVQCSHEPSLERRLAASQQAIERKKTNDD